MRPNSDTTPSFQVQEPDCEHDRDREPEPKPAQERRSSDQMLMETDMGTTPSLEPTHRNVVSSRHKIVGHRAHWRGYVWMEAERDGLPR